MNTQTFLLNNFNTFSPKATKLLFSISGSLILALYVYQWISKGEIDIHNPIVFFGSINFILIGTIGLSKKSPFAPKVKVTEHDIVLRKDLFGKNTNVFWSDLEKIELGSYRLTFYKEKSYFTYHLDTTKETSIAIKHAIREAGHHKNIRVTGC